MRHLLWIGFLGIGSFLLIAGCSGPKKVATVPAGAGEKVIGIKAQSFDFDPDIIRTRPGDRLVLEVENISGMGHNITVKSPSGTILVSRNLPAHETVRLELGLEEKGEYPFYCDKPMHPTLGMKGVLMVE